MPASWRTHVPATLEYGRSKRFWLSRKEDVTGTSGAGLVAEGVQFSDGAVVLRWLSKTPSTVCYNSLDDVIAVHGHDGRTVVLWRD